MLPILIRVLPIWIRSGCIRIRGEPIQTRERAVGIGGGRI
jgi:hypothetical protein